MLTGKMPVLLRGLMSFLVGLWRVFLLGIGFFAFVGLRDDTQASF